ncbi:unnamed protein product [Blepharisma stoltei]|uniref:Potassium channel domain-containing protein n=1 Tax=Blepharisma stoltei TaxID=1481888 RepID=A0AAU9IKH0_9CILI|nr:unnamed protein product [Blepharisma stoltei]
MSDSVRDDTTFDLSRVEEPKKIISHKNTLKTDLRKVVPKGTLGNSLEFVCKKQLKIDLINAALAFSSIMIVYYESEEFYKQDTKCSAGECAITKSHNESNDYVTSMRVTNIGITLVILCLIYQHYLYELDKMKIRKQVPPQSTLKTSNLLQAMVPEMVIMGIFCPPYFDSTFSGTMLNGKYVYSYDVIIAVLTILRVFLILRVYTHFSIWLSNESFKEGKKLGVNTNVFFALKADLKYQPHIILSAAIGTLVICIGYAVRDLERPFVSTTKSRLNFDYLTNGWWMTVVTMTTVGYGDGYPSTHFGRALMLFTAIAGLVMVSLYVVTLTVATMFSKEETKAYYMIKKVKANSDVRHKASNVIKATFKLKEALMRKRGANYLRRVFIYGALLRRHIHYFKRDTSVANTRYLPPPEMLVQLEQKLISDIDDIRKEIIDIDYIGERLQELIGNQQMMTENLDKILNAQNTIERLMTQANIEQLIKGGKEEADNKLT